MLAEDMVLRDIPETDCVEWLCNYIQVNTVVSIKQVCAAGQKLGFARNSIKAARRYWGNRINTRVENGETFWSWKER